MLQCFILYKKNCISNLGARETSLLSALYYNAHNKINENYIHIFCC